MSKENKKRYAIVSAYYRRQADRQYCLEALLLDPAIPKEDHDKYFETTGMSHVRWITIGVYKTYSQVKTAQSNLNSGKIKVSKNLIPPQQGAAYESKHTLAA